MSKRKGLDFAAGRLGISPKQDNSCEEEAAPQVNHYNGSRLGIVSDTEPAANDQSQAKAPTTQEPRADTTPAVHEQPTDAAPATQPAIAASTDDEGAATAEAPEPLEQEQAIAADAAIAAESQPEQTDCASSSEQDHEICDADDVHDEAPDATLKPPSEQPAEPAEAPRATKGTFRRFGASSRPDDSGNAPGKPTRFNVEIYASGPRRSWLPIAAAILAAGCALGWFVWQRVEKRLNMPQTASATVAQPVQMAIENPVPAPTPKDKPGAAATSKATPDSQPETAEDNWIGKLASSLASWAEVQAKNAVLQAANTAKKASNADKTKTNQGDKPSPRYRECPPGIVLTSVLLDGSRPMASINGLFVTVGSIIKGARVVKIRDHSVLMELNGELFDVPLGVIPQIR